MSGRSEAPFARIPVPPLAGRDPRHHPVRLGPQAGVLGRAHPHRPRLGPHRPARAHLQAGLGLGPVGLVRGRAQGEALPAVRRQLPEHRPAPRCQTATTAIARKWLLTRAYHLLTGAARGGAPRLAVRSQPSSTPDRRRITIRRQSGWGPLQLPRSSADWRPVPGESSPGRPSLAGGALDPPVQANSCAVGPAMAPALWIMMTSAVRSG